MVVGGVHGVAVDSGCRRAGVFRRIMGELLPFADGQYETLALTTAHPEYFEPFGFRVVSESVFVTRVDRPAGHPRVRRLELSRPADRATMHRLLERRAAVSPVLSSGPDKAGWAFYEAGSELRYSEDLDLVIIAERDGVRLRLYDVIGERIPPLDDLLSALGEPVEEVVAFFAPDRLDARFESRPHDLTGGPLSLERGIMNGRFMVRGGLVVARRALMLPRPARC